MLDVFKIKDGQATINVELFNLINDNKGKNYNLVKQWIAENNSWRNGYYNARKALNIGFISNHNLIWDLINQATATNSDITFEQ